MSVCACVRVSERGEGGRIEGLYVCFYNERVLLG